MKKKAKLLKIKIKKSWYYLGLFLNYCVQPFYDFLQLLRFVNFKVDTASNIMTSAPFRYLFH